MKIVIAVEALFAALVIGLFLVATAAAQTGTGTVTTTTVDISPLAAIIRDYVVPAVGTIISALLIALASWALAIFSRYTGVKISAAAEQKLDAAIPRAIAFAEHEADGSLKNLPPVEMRNAVAAAALNYVASNAQGALNTLGITPAASQGLAERITAQVAIKLGTELSPPAAPPVQAVLVPVIAAPANPA